MTDQPIAPIRIALIGTARRAAAMYGPILRAMPGVELVAVWGRSEDSARRLGEQIAIPAYTDLDRLIREAAPQIGIVCVAYGATGHAGLLAVEHGLNVLLETPIAHDLAEADAIIAAARQRGVKIEVAEQFHRRPLEQIKLKLLALGLLLCVGFNLALHLVYGDDPMLYSPDWVYALVLFVAFSLQRFAAQKWFLTALSVFLIALITNNLHLLEQIMQASAPFYGK